MTKRTLSHKSGRGAPLGQHFLTGIWAARKLVEAAAIGADDTVLEIGPGKGALTKELLATGTHVIAVEKDSVLAKNIPNYIGFTKPNIIRRLTVIERDIREVMPETLGLKNGGYILAANIPYYITGEILRKFLTAEQQPSTMALLVQKEVAERIIARNNKESILSLSVKCYGESSIAAIVKRGNFSPPPSVDSAILIIKNISRAFFTDVDEKKFFDTVKAGFASKRKQLFGNLAKKFGREHVESALSACDIPRSIRAEDVSLLKWRCIAQHVT